MVFCYDFWNTNIYLVNTVSFFYADRTLSIRNKLALKRFVKEVFLKEKKKLNKVHYIFCSDDYLLGINQQYLNHNDYTDIITFDLSEKSTEIIGEIYISLDRVRDNAQKLGLPYAEELIRVIVHGVLHLCGYKDKRKSEIIIMRNKEANYIRLFEVKTS